MSLSDKYKHDLKYISLGIKLFNLVYLNKKNIDNTKILGKIKISKETSLYKDYYIRIISHTMSKTNWYDLFHMNFKETLDLEYSSWVYLKNILDEYEEELKKETAKTEEELNNKYKYI